VRYQDVYPSEALLRSFDLVRPRAAELLNLEFFEAEPAGMPTAVFDQHHLLLNLQEESHRVENWRNGTHRDFTYRVNEIVLTPAGISSGWYWHARSKVIVITIDPAPLERFARSELGIILTERQVKGRAAGWRTLISATPAPCSWMPCRAARPAPRSCMRASPRVFW
jgi:AraC family transcriptional regulator